MNIIRQSIYTEIRDLPIDFELIDVHTSDVDIDAGKATIVVRVSKGNIRDALDLIFQRLHDIEGKYNKEEPSDCCNL